MAAPRDQDKTGERTDPWARFMGAGILPRIAVIVVGVPLTGWIALTGGLLFNLFILLIVLLGLREFFQMAEAKGYEPFRTLGFLGGVGLCGYVILFGGSVDLPLAVVIMSLMIAELFRHNINRALTHIAITIFGILYVGWLGAHLALLRVMEAPGAGIDDFGLRALAFAVSLTWVCDILAYLVGVLFGKHPLWPRVSPKKSIEGSIGGLIGAGATGAVAAATFLPVIPIWTGLVIGLAGGAMAQIGDLVESLLKRDAGVKDSATLLPGHGGILDRFDSLFFVSPMVYYLLKILVA